MATAVETSQPPTTLIAVPPSQNTAPVVEFRCLYTSDLRRKQKRWQDGRLKYHTFNKRIMVYDDRSNYVGDTHWREDCDLTEGDEVELDRSGMLVQVADCIGKKDQDLTELLDKRIKEREERIAARASISVTVSSPIRAPLANTHAQTPTSLSLRQSHAYVGPEFVQSRPKTLSAVLGTPVGLHGRATIPKMSPFSKRQEAINSDKNSTERLAKCRKPDSSLTKNGYAQQLTGASLTLSGRPASTTPLRLGSWGAQKRRTFDRVETIDVSNVDEEDIVMPVNLDLAGRERLKRKRPQNPSSDRPEFASSITDTASTVIPGLPDSLAQVLTSGKAVKQSAISPLGDTAAAETETIDGFVDIEVFEQDHFNLAVQNKEPSKRRCRSPQFLIPRAPQACPDLPVARGVRVNQQNQHQLAATRPQAQTEQPGKPSNPLRIKSRSKKKMLYMALTQIMVPSVTEEILATELDPPSLCSPSNQESWQATAQLEALLHDQKNRLQARIGASRVPNADQSKFPSSAEDSCIGRHAIERLVLPKAPSIIAGDVTRPARTNTSPLPDSLLRPAMKITEPENHFQDVSSLEIYSTSPYSQATSSSRGKYTIAYTADSNTSKARLSTPLQGRVEESTVVESSFPISVAATSARAISQDVDAKAYDNGNFPQLDSQMCHTVSDIMHEPNTENGIRGIHNTTRVSTTGTCNLIDVEEPSTAISGLKGSTQAASANTTTGGEKAAVGLLKVGKLLANIYPVAYLPVPIPLPSNVRNSTRLEENISVAHQSGTMTTNTVVENVVPNKQDASGNAKHGIDSKDLGPWSREAFDLFDWKPK